jgi:hypothetical protein
VFFSNIQAMSLTKHLPVTVIILVVLLISCKKDETIYQAHFWTSRDTATVKMDIYINDVKKGPVQFLPVTPEYCEDSAFKTLTAIPLKTGPYIFKAMDQKGNTRFSGNIEIMKGGSVIVKDIHGGINICSIDNNLFFGISD